MIKHKKENYLFKGKTNNCPLNCLEANNDVGTIDLQVAYDTSVSTAIRTCVAWQS